MPRFCKKSAIVNAEQFHGFYGTPYPPGVYMEDNSNDPSKQRYLFYIVMSAYAQKTYIEAGDWIIAEPDGIHYSACKPDVFAAIYEEIK